MFTKQKVGKGKMEKESRNCGVKKQNWIGDQKEPVLRISLCTAQFAPWSMLVSVGPFR